jgi:hypothetical protein
MHSFLLQKLYSLERVKFWAKEYELQCDVIENRLGITWQLEEQIGSVIENHWEPGGNNLL